MICSSTLAATQSSIAQQTYWERGLLDNVELAIHGSVRKSVGLNHAPGDFLIPAVVENACMLDNRLTHECQQECRDVGGALISSA